MIFLEIRPVVAKIERGRKSKGVEAIKEGIEHE